MGMTESAQNAALRWVIGEPRNFQSLEVDYFHPGLLLPMGTLQKQTKITFWGKLPINLKSCLPSAFIIQYRHIIKDNWTVEEPWQCKLIPAQKIDNRNPSTGAPNIRIVTHKQKRTLFSMIRWLKTRFNISADNWKLKRDTAYLNKNKKFQSSKIQ